MSQRSAVVRVLRILALAPVVLLTLVPVSGEKIGSGWQYCLVCGQVGTAAALLNIVLFVPIGAALALGRRRAWLYVLCAGAVSVGIETMQQFLPGRNPTAGDIIFNTLGAALGVLMVRRHALWLDPPPRTAQRLVTAAGAALMMHTALVAFVAQPASTDGLQFGLWTPDLRHLQHYDGVVEAAQIDGLDIPAGAAFPDRDAAVAVLRAWSSVQVTAVAGSRTSGLAPLVAVFDSAQHENLLLGLDGDDIVLRYRRNASQLRLMDPQVRLAGGGRLEQGARLDVTATRVGRQHCITINERTQCGGGMTVGRGWSLLRAAGIVPASAEPAASAAWLALLALPLGFWLRTGRGMLPGLTLATASLAAAPLFAPLLPAPPLEWAGTAVGVVAGWALGRFVRRGMRGPTPSTEPLRQSNTVAVENGTTGTA